MGERGRPMPARYRNTALIAFALAAAGPLLGWAVHAAMGPPRADAIEDYSGIVVALYTAVFMALMGVVAVVALVVGAIAAWRGPPRAVSGGWPRDGAGRRPPG